MRVIRPLITVALCAALLLAVTPAATASPNNDGPRTVATVGTGGWLDWIGSVLGQLMPWSIGQPNATTGDEPGALRSLAASTQTDTSPGTATTTLTTSTTTNSDAGLAADPDG